MVIDTVESDTRASMELVKPSPTPPRRRVRTLTQPDYSLLYCIPDLAFHFRGHLG